MKGSILVIDDNPSIAEVLDLILTAEDYAVTTLHNGSDIFDVIQKCQPSVIILDYLLVEEKGTDIAKKIKGNEATCHIPLIMISAHPNAQTDAKQAGIDAFLEKPFDTHQLLDFIHKYM